MPQGDKYLGITNYLKAQHSCGNDEVTLTLDAIAKIQGFALTDTQLTYSWNNDRTQSSSLGWMNAGFIVDGSKPKNNKIKFVYNPIKVKELLDGNGRHKTESVTKPSHYKSHQAKLRNDVPEPSVDEVDKYLILWKTLDGYVAQENALNKLFHDMCPHNTNINDVLLKVATLNDFYSTNIYSVYPVAQHILDLNIDGRLATGDKTLVNEIMSVEMKEKELHFYSFASKYCSHHNENEYAIYDSYVDKVLRYYRGTYGFAQFKNDDLKDYEKFCGIVKEFQAFFGIDKYTVKEIDKYLWQFGKEKFPNKQYKKGNSK